MSTAEEIMSGFTWFFLALTWGVIIRSALRTRRAAKQAKCLGTDLALANWTRNTMLVVTTRTGYVYAVNLADLATDEMGSTRCWSEPAAVTVSYGPPYIVNNIRDHANTEWNPDA